MEAVGVLVLCLRVRKTEGKCRNKWLNVCPYPFLPVSKGNRKQLPCCVPSQTYFWYFINFVIVMNMDEIFDAGR